MLQQQNRNALRLSYATVAYNLVEGVIAVLAAISAGSPALIGFGADSFVESLSGLVMVWRFTGNGGHRERPAVRLVGLTLVILALYVAYESTAALLEDDPPQASLVGILIAIASLIVMPILFVLKRRVAKALNARSLLADARQTLGCVCLSVALLVGLGLNYSFGLWRADPIAGLLIAAYLAWEGYRALTERELCRC
jgi:divalent metal cation (Fe/Co/Zn/Cd) transporter